MTVDADIMGLGRHGDGMARIEGRTVAVPFTLPDERVRLAGEPPALAAVLRSSKDRVTPPCRHFGRCGGCQLQHMDRNALLEWKRGRVVSALHREGVEASVDKTVGCEPHSRRRAVFSATRSGGELILGFRARGTDEIVPMVECHVLVPAIVDALPDLRAVAATALAGSAPISLTVTACENGLDVAIATGRPATDDTLSALVRVASRAGIVRCTVNATVAMEQAAPVVRFGDAGVVPPPGAFLQAVEETEARMAQLVTDHLAGSGRVADLFAGSGTFALRLARTTPVDAFESDAAALQALADGADASAGLRKVATQVRDLFAEPLIVPELKPYDALVLDPPRAGAAAQAAQLAKAKVPRLAYVSCNPETMARDLSVLTKRTYRIERVVPLDQFLWTPHVEVVALLTLRDGDAARPRRSIFR